MPEKIPSQIFLLPVIFIASLLIALFIYSKWGPAIPLSVNQITTTKTDLFSVSAEGRTFAPPDTAVVELGFTTAGPSVGQVQSQANATINNVVAAVKKAGVGESDIKTTSYNLQPSFVYTPDQTQKITGYSANVNIEVKVRDFAKINDVIDAATGSGANQVGGLSFTIDNPDKFIAQARKQAIDKAKQKASEIASETGITLGRIVDFSENNAGPRPLPLTGPVLKTADSAAPTQIEPGSSEISVTVTLSYETR